MADIVITDVNPRNRYEASGGETGFDFTFPIFDQSHLQVQASDPDDLNNPETLVIGTDYTVTGVGESAGGEIVFNPTNHPTGAEADFIYTISRQMPYERLNDYQFSGDFESSDVNTDFDSQEMQIQQLNRDIQASPRLDVTDELETLPIKIATAANRANRALQFNTLGTGLEEGPTSSDIINAQSFAVAADASATAAAGSATIASTKAAEASADADAVAAALELVTIGPSQPKVEVITSGFTAGSTTSLTISVTPRPSQEEAFDLYYFNTSNALINSPAPDRYTYNPTTGVISLSDVVTTGTTKIVVKWWTSLNTGTPGDKSVNWLTKMTDQAINTIAGWAADGVSMLYSFVTTISAPTDVQIPSALAVKTYTDAAISTAVSGIVQYREKVQSTILGSGVSSVDIEFDEGYDYYIKVDDIGPASDGNNLTFRFANAGVPVTGNNYRFNAIQGYDATASSYSNSSASTSTLLSNPTGNGTARTVTGEIFLPNPNNGDRIGCPGGIFKTRCHRNTADEGVTYDGSFDYKSPGAAFDSGVILWSAGNFRNQGRITVYREPI